MFLLVVMNGVTRRMMPTSVYWTLVLLAPVSLITLPEGSGTDWPTRMTASWLLRARMDGRESTATLPRCDRA